MVSSAAEIQLLQSPTFMGIARELRDKIYAETFAREEQRELDWEKPKGFVSLELLRVNKQIYEEALEVLLKHNRFFHVKTNAIGPIRQTLRLHGIQVIAVEFKETNRMRAIESFKQYVMTVNIEHPAGSKHVRHIMMVEKRNNIELFVKAFAELNNHPDKMQPIRNELKVTVTLEKPLAIDNFATEKIHGRILDIIETHWWSIRSFKLEGHHDEGALTRVEQKVRGNRWSSSDDFSIEAVRQCQAVRAASRAAMSTDASDQAIERAAYRILRTTTTIRTMIMTSLRCNEGIEMCSNSNIQADLDYPYFLLNLVDAEASMNQAIRGELPRNRHESIRRGTEGGFAHLTLESAQQAVHAYKRMIHKPHPSEYAMMLYLRAVGLRLSGKSGILALAIKDICNAGQAERKGNDDPDMLRKIATEERTIRDLQELHTREWAPEMRLLGDRVIRLQSLEEIAEMEQLVLAFL